MNLEFNSVNDLVLLWLNGHTLHYKNDNRFKKSDNFIPEIMQTEIDTDQWTIIPNEDTWTQFLGENSKYIFWCWVWDTDFVFDAVKDTNVIQIQRIISFIDNSYYDNFGRTWKNAIPLTNTNSDTIKRMFKVFD